MPNDVMTKCLRKANVTYVLTMGDSTAAEHNAAQIRYMDLNYRCRLERSETLKSDGFLPDEDYFAKQIPEKVMNFLNIQFRFCRGCKSQLNVCNMTDETSPLSGENQLESVEGNENHTVAFEHLSQTMILDNSLHIAYPTYNDAHSVMRTIWALTTQEVLLRYYIHDHYPDLFVIFIPFMHAKHSTLLSRVPLEIAYFKGLVEEYIPKTTKVFYIVTHYEFILGEKPSWADHLFEGMSAAGIIQKMNRALYDVLKDDLADPASQIFGFYDMFKISSSRGNWSLDGVHMQHIYYDVVMDMFWQTFCNSVLLDQF
jgi:hypothetical protein